MNGSIANAAIIVNVLAMLAMLSPGRASAHPEFAPSTVNHYLKIDLVDAAEARLAYTLMVGAAPALAWRRDADADGDGALSEIETRAIGERARAAVLAGLALTVDGDQMLPAFQTPIVGLAGDGVTASPFSVDLIARVSFKGGGRHTLVVDDAVREPMLGETEIRIAESPATRLVSSHRGAVGDEKETTFKFRGQKFSALEDRSVTLTFTAAARPAAAAEGRPSLRLFEIGIGIGLSLALGFALRRYLKT